MAVIHRYALRRSETAKAPTPARAPRQVHKGPHHRGSRAVGHGCRGPSVAANDDDMSGQTIRRWKIEVHAGHVTIRSRDELSFLMIRAADIPIFRLT